MNNCLSSSKNKALEFSQEVNSRLFETGKKDTFLLSIGRREDLLQNERMKSLTQNVFTQKYPVVLVFIIQLFALFFLRNLFFFAHLSVSSEIFLLIQILICVGFSLFIFKMPKWIVLISILFPFMIYIAFNYLQVASWVYAVLFIFFIFSFSHTLRERVPLYLTNSTTNVGLSILAKKMKAKKIVDLGSGTGGVVRFLGENGEWEVIGVESAFLLWLQSSFLSRLTRKGRVLRKNIWHINLYEFDFVYAFLSPAIMEKLFQKALKEMKKNTVFVSNSFPVPNIEADEVWELDDKRRTTLYIYKINC